MNSALSQFDLSFCENEHVVTTTDSPWRGTFYTVTCGEEVLAKREFLSSHDEDHIRRFLTRVMDGHYVEVDRRQTKHAVECIVYAWKTDTPLNFEGVRVPEWIQELVK